MKIEKIAENKIRIILNREDFKEQNIDLHTIMSKAAESQNLLLMILNKAQEEIANLKAQITAIQNENKNKDISNHQDKTLDEQIVDIFNQML